MKCLLALLAIVVLAPAVCLAQALADHVPGDAVLYVGWRGTDDLGSGYDQSHFKAVLDASQMRELLNQCLPKMIDHLAVNTPGQKVAGQVRDISRILVQHPLAIYFGGIDPANQPLPLKAMILCNAGKDAELLVGHINQLLEDAPVPLNVNNTGGLVTLGTVTLNPAGATLAANKDFQAVMGQLVKDPVMAIYVDGAGLNQTIENGIRMSGNKQLAQMWPQMRDGLGLPGLKHIGLASGFAGKDWLSVGLIDAPAATRTGLLAFFNAPPVSEETLKLIPASATVASAGMCDLGAGYKAIRNLVEQMAPPQINAQIDDAIEQANQATGMNLETDLVDAFGPEWAVYIDPATMGNGFLGVTVINRPRNAAALEGSLSKLELFANNLIKENVREPKLTLGARQETVEGTNLHFWALPFVSPVWTMKNGVWYAGAYPQTVVAAAKGNGGKSLLDNPAYQEARRRLNAPAKVNAVTFLDLPKLTPDGYQGLLMLSQIYVGLGDLFGLQSPAMVFPPLDKLAAETGPVCSVSWTDEAGFHVKSIEPYPGSSVIANSAMFGPAGTIGMAEGPLMISILLPSLNRSREMANRVKSASNERQIGQAILLYSNENKGAYPPDLGTLIKTEDITAEVFVAPEANVTVPANLPPDAAAAWVNKNSSYVYIGAGMKQGVEPGTIVLYEKPEIHGDGSNVLYGDGSVRFVQAKMLQLRLGLQKQGN